jgi:MFS family permease
MSTRPSRPRLVTRGAVVLILAAIAKIAYGWLMTVSIGIGGEYAPFRRLSVVVGIAEILLAAAILGGLRWAATLGTAVAAGGIGAALWGISELGFRDPGSAFLVLAFLVAYVFVFVSLALTALPRGRRPRPAKP